MKMTKRFLIILVALLWCNVGFAECIKGDCNNGYGTHTWANGDKYIGEFKDNKANGQGTFIGTDGTVMKCIWENGELIERQE